MFFEETFDNKHSAIIEIAQFCDQVFDLPLFEETKEVKPDTILLAMVLDFHLGSISKSLQTIAHRIAEIEEHTNDCSATLANIEKSLDNIEQTIEEKEMQP